jgi:8-oxo-dGTP diphosphatase
MQWFGTILNVCRNETFGRGSLYCASLIRGLEQYRTPFQCHVCTKAGLTPLGSPQSHQIEFQQLLIRWSLPDCDRNYLVSSRSCYHFGIRQSVRNQIRDEVECIGALDSLEREQIADALAWIDSGVELCRTVKPATPPKHLVAYFVVVDRGFVLLVDHKSAQRWLPTGGHVELGEHPRSTVTREMVEELGFPVSHAVGPPLMLTVTMTVGDSASHTDVSLWYVVHGNREQSIRFDNTEFKSVKWFSLNEIPFENSDPHMARFIAKLSLPETHDERDSNTV